MAHPFYTIGHSTRSIEEFVDLLRPQRIKRVIDVRTIPRSRTNPQYNAEEFDRRLCLSFKLAMNTLRRSEVFAGVSIAYRRP